MRFIVKYTECGKEKEYISKNLFNALSVLGNANSFVVYKEQEDGSLKCVAASVDRVKKGS